MKEYLTIALFVCVPVLCGCSGSPKPDGMPRLYPFELTIVGEGIPLKEAMIGLYSEEPGFRWGIGGVTDEHGRIKLATHGKYLGVPEGKFIVTVEKLERDDYDPLKPPMKIKVFTYTKSELTDRKTSPLRLTVDRKKRAGTLDIGKIERTFLRMEDTY